jgi:WD40 repeat protein
MADNKHSSGIEQKPVIFLAFANDRVDRAGYLRNLAKEQREIRKALEKAKQAGLCEVIERFNATSDDILDVFQDKAYKDRIAIFHYGGHADCYRLLLESVTGARSYAFKEGLVSFLARQIGLKLIFLNACSTEQHAVELKQAGIPAVIGTSQEIADTVATMMAIRFYHGIANGHSIERAWREAEDHIKIQFGLSNFNALYHWEQQEKHKDRFPWDIHFKEGAGEVKEWNLPGAANDLLFGLPAIPQTCQLPDKPFLFLNRYERKHAEIFFGRSYYIRGLYSRVTDRNSPPIILLYGQSGVGKSSLLEAGLLPRLEETHNIIYIRRDQEKGLLGTLEEALLKNYKLQNTNHKQITNQKLQITNKNEQSPQHPIAPIPHYLKSLSQPTSFSHLPVFPASQLPSFPPGQWKEFEVQSGKPLVIIVDQVEEVFTRPNKSLHNEFKDFLEALKSIFGNPLVYLEGKLILSYRKEYHPEIDKQLGMNELDRWLLFLEPLNRQDIIEVVTGLTRTQRLKDRYNLNVEDQLPVIIADDLLADRASPVAPTLQIVLTKMWDISKKDEFSPVREFTIDRYRELRREGLFMEDFFEQQMEKLRNWKKDLVDPGLALDLLKFHTTGLGTACSRTIEEMQQTYRHYGDMIDDLVKKLKELYLLTDTNHSKNETSLAHDTLAPVIIKEYNDSDKPGQRAARILAAKIEDFKKNPGDTWLNEADLLIVEQGKDGMRTLTNKEGELLEESRKRKLQQERQIKRFKTIRMVSVILIVIAALIAVWQWQAAWSRAREININYRASQAQLDVEKDPTIALRLVERAWQLNKNGITTPAIYMIYRENNFYRIIARLTREVKSVGFSNDSRYIVANFHDGTTRSWDLTGKEITGFKAHNPGKTYAEFLPDDQYPPIKSGDGVIRLWDEKRNKYQDFIGHEGRVRLHIVSPDGKYVLTGAEDKTARLWDLQGNQWQVFRGHEGAVTSVAFSPDGRYIITASTDMTIRLWELKDKELQCFAGHGGEIESAVFSPDGQHFLTGTADGTAALWDLQGNRLKVFNEPGPGVTAVAFSPDGKYIVAGFKKGPVRLWDMTGKEFQTLNGNGYEISAVAFSPDGGKILTGSYDKTARLWDLNGKELQVFKGHKHRVTSAVFSPDGQYILTGSYDKTAHLWNLEGKEQQVFEGHNNFVTGVAFSPDGKYVLTGSFDQTARLWDLKGKELTVFKGHGGIIYTVAFSPDGQYVLTGSADKTACVWDLKGNQLQVFRGHEGAVRSVACKFNQGSKFSGTDISREDQYVLTGSSDGTVRLWKIYPLEVFLANGTCELLSPGKLKEYGID